MNGRSLSLMEKLQFARALLAQAGTGLAHILLTDCEHDGIKGGMWILQRMQ